MNSCQLTFDLFGGVFRTVILCIEGKLIYSLVFVLHFFRGDKRSPKLSTAI